MTEMRPGFFDKEILCGYEVSAKMKKIWAVQLDLLNEFRRICDEHGLRYCIWSGTLLGAVRHNGFIPWDDDIDVAMLREDYDRFCKLAPQTMQEPYRLQTSKNDAGIFWGNLCRLRNSDTTGVEFSDIERRSNWGIWIDILALDYIYEDEQKRQEQLRKVAIYKRLCQLQTYGENYGEFSKLVPWKKKIYRFLVKRMGRERLLARYEDACRVCPAEEARFVGTFTGNFHIENYRCYYKEDFETTKVLPFEHLKLSAPAGYKRYLEMSNGNYMEYPPQEKRCPKHTGIFDPDTPYEVWQKRLTGAFIGLEGKVLVVFGAGNMFEDYMRRFGTQYRPAFLVDNGKGKWGKTVHGIMVHDPSELLRFPKDKLRVIICNIYFREIAAQLEEMGITDYCLHIENKWWLNDILFPQRLAKKKVEGKLCRLDFATGWTIQENSGKAEQSSGGYATTLMFYKGKKGEYLVLNDSDYEFGVATYSKEVKPNYIYTYSYAPEENWTTYNCDFSDGNFRRKPYTFHDDVFFRIVIRRTDRAELPEGKKLGNVLWHYEIPEAEKPRSVFADEIRKTATKILEKKGNHTLTLALLADSHYTVNGTWEDTAYTVEAVHRQAWFDAIVHLGDLTDGMVPQKVTESYVKKVLSDLRRNKVPVYTVLGNHDSNYFGENKEPFTNQQQYKLYYGEISDGRYFDLESGCYCKDYESLKLRLLFLTSFDYQEPIRYGFSDAVLVWLRKCLEETPADFKVIVFSHVPPLPQIHYWSKSIRNGEEVVGLLEKYQANSRKCSIMAYVHGHNHADQIYREKLFPIISIGCSKLEYFTDKKPDGAQTPERKPGMVSQELWDTMVIDPQKNRIDFIRFGAGEDRLIIG